MLGVEARGFILAAPVAYRIGAGSCPCARPASCRGQIEREEYELEYGTDLLEIHRDAIHPGERVLIIDDVLATGGTAAATVRLVERARRRRSSGSGFVIELGFLGGRATADGDRDVRRASLARLRVGASAWPPSTGSCRGGATARAAAVELAPLLDGLPRAGTRRRRPALITQAYELAGRGPRGQTRKSGEPYINHPLAVAKHRGRPRPRRRHRRRRAAARRGRGHRRPLADVERDSAPRSRAIVDGVTKLDRIQFDSKEAQQAATMRKMLVAMAKDLRVLIIKLADRLHNMRTLAAMPAWKQQRIAQETLDIYAPLAHRLGMQEMKQQLEDLSFAALHPKRYAEIDHMVATRSPERDVYLAQVLERGARPPGELGIDAEVTGRPKHLWSIYEKMVVEGPASSTTSSTWSASGWWSTR